MMLFIQSLLTGDFVSLRFKLAIVGIAWLLVAIAIIIDLFSGVRKARERGEMRTSIGFRQTVSKVVQYYAFLAFAFLFDCMLMLVLAAFWVEAPRVLPFSSIGACCFLIFIEWKSFMEKASDKYKKQFSRSVSDLATLLENREDLLHGLIEIIKKQVEESKSYNNEEDK